MRSLEVLKQNVNHDVFLSMVKSKLPEQILLQLEIQKGSTEKWTVLKACERSRVYIVAKEKFDNFNLKRSVQIVEVMQTDPLILTNHGRKEMKNSVRVKVEHQINKLILMKL